MILLHPIKHDGKLYKAGKFTGNLPKKILDDFKNRGYFSVEVTPKKADK